MLPKWLLKRRKEKRRKMKPIRKEAKRAIREYLRLHQKGVSCATESAL